MMMSQQEAYDVMVRELKAVRRNSDEAITTIRQLQNTIYELKKRIEKLEHSPMGQVNSVGGTKLS